MAVFKPQDIFAGRYQLQKLLGLGGFSEVWQVMDQMAENTILALKIYAAGAGLDEDGIELFRREYSLTLPLNHKNLLKPNYFDIAEGSPYLVMPLCEKGSLTKKLFREGTLKEETLALMMVNVADGLAYLHQRSPVVLHQDIKPDNVLITAKDEYLLSDFGISSRMRHTMMKSTRSTTSSNSLTIAYAPPEKFSSRPKSVPASDIFSFGVMLYELSTNEVPWMGHGGQSLLTGSAVPELPEIYSPEFNQIVQACMNLEPSQRPTAEQLHQLTLIYLDKGKWQDFEKITNYKESVFPGASERSVTHPENLVTVGEGADTDENIASLHNTDAHPDLNLGDEANVDETPIRSERVTESVSPKKKKALAKKKRTTFDRNVYIFLGIVLVLLVGLIGREYSKRGNNDGGNKANILANNEGNYNDSLQTKANTDVSTDESRNEKNDKTSKTDETVDTEEKTSEADASDKEDNTDQDLEAKDLQEKLRALEERVKEQEKIIEKKEKSKQLFDDFEVFKEEKSKKSSSTPTPPKPPQPKLIISDNGLTIDKTGKTRSKGNGIEINLSDEVVDLVREIEKSGGDKKKIEAWSRKISKKYEKLGKEFEKKYKYKRNSQRNRSKKEYPYTEKYPDGYLVRKGKKWGYLDRKGRVLIRPQYDGAWPFHEGLAAVKRGGKWGYINRNNRLVIGYKYSKPGNFSKGKASVIYRGKRIYINHYGKCVENCYE
ncbi:hypothetical protein BKI52_22130 [marine bacterium AO1-C]|nr:hypothetical protein BKI52_22130 [marine bacterium AO1-C]